MQNTEDTRRVRKERYDKDCVVRKFNTREIVMTKLPGLQKEHGMGPLKCWMCHRNFIVIDITGKNCNAIRKRVHINQYIKCRLFTFLCWMWRTKKLLTEKS